MNDLSNWNNLRVFLTIAEAGSITQASAKLGTTQSTLSRRLMQLETDLGVELLIRDNRNFGLTDAGQRVVDAARRMRNEAVAVTTTTTHTSPKAASAVISAPSTLINIWLINEMRGFLDKRPNHSIDFIHTDEAAQPAGCDADVLVRFCGERHPDPRNTFLGDVHVNFYASRDYLRDRGNPASRRALSSHLGIGIAHECRFAVEVDQALRGSDLRLRVHDVDGALAAATSGWGIAPIYSFVGDAHPDLIRVLDDESTIIRPLWIRTHEDRLADPYLEQIAHHIASGFSRIGRAASR